MMQPAIAEEVVTLKTIAVQANCAVSTVSRALRDDAAISQGAKDAIRRVAANLGYQSAQGRKARAASAMGNQFENKRLAILTLGLDRSLRALPVVASTINGVEDVLSSLGVQLEVIHVPDLNEVPSHLSAARFDGLFLQGALHGRMIADSARWLTDELRSIPSVWLLRRPEGAWGDGVGANDVQLGMMAADYLIDHGHQRIAFLSPKPDHSIMRDREGGFVAQAFRRGAEVTRFVGEPPMGWTMPMRPPMTTDAVQGLVDQFLATSPRPTAIFAAADSVAMVLYGALAKRGVKVGEDVSVISGNNDAPLIAGLHPALTTFDIQPQEIGRLAVRQMASLLNSSAGQPGVELTIAPKLVERESVVRLGS